MEQGLLHDFYDNEPISLVWVSYIAGRNAILEKQPSNLIT